MVQAEISIACPKIERDMLDRDLLLLNVIRASLRETLSQDDIRKSFDGTLEWGKLLEYAQRNGISSLLYHILKTAGADVLLPKQFISQLEISYYSVFTQNVSYYRELELILDSFRHSGIQPIVLKGAALGETLYLDMSLRPLSDIDMFIRKRDLLKAKKELLLIGYENIVKDYHQGHGDEFGEHFTYLKHESIPLYVDLHTRLFPPICNQDSEINGLWDRSVEIQMGGISGLALSLEDTVLYLCSHAFKHGLPIRLLWLYDLALMFLEHGESLNWKFMEKRARMLGIYRISGHVLEVARQTFDIPLPDGAASWLRSCELNRVERFLSANESGRAIWYHALRLRSVKVMKDKLRFIAGRMFPSRDYIMWRYSISNPKLVFWGYLYRFYYFHVYFLKTIRAVFTSMCGSRVFRRSA